MLNLTVSSLSTALLTVLYALVLLLVTVWAVWAMHPKRRRLAKDLDKLPGPATLPFFGNTLIALIIKREDVFLWLDKLTKKYWPLFRVWNGVNGIVHISDADHIEAITSSSTNITKGFIYKFVEPWLGTGLLTARGQKWHAHRKLITPAFHFKILDSFLEVFTEKSRILVTKLEKEIDNKEGFNLYPYITNCTLDIICETAMGTEVNAQSSNESLYVAAIYDIAQLVLLRLFRPWLHNDFIYGLTREGRRFKKNIDVVHSFTTKVIRQRKEARREKQPQQEETEEVFGKKKRLAFLDLLLEAAEGGAALTDEEIREEVDTFMFEGHDTTATSLTWTLYLLGAYPEIQAKVHEELDSIFQDSDRAPTMGDLAEMKYMERVLKEALRLYPSVPLISRVITEPVKFDQYTLPKGCQATLHIYHVHRDPKHFPNPDEFDPDNFLPERVQGRHPFAFVPFSAGPRNCIGQKFALLEEKTVLAEVLRKYRVRSLAKREDVTLLLELVLRPANGIQMAIERR